MSDFWRTPICLAPRGLRPWLGWRASLTARLQREYGPVRVKITSGGFACPHPDEFVACRCHRPCTLFQIREVLLQAGNQSLVFAHSVARRDASRQGLRILSKIGTRPLGAALFADPQIRRGPLQFKRIDRRDRLWQKANALAGPLPAQLWARRSHFLRGHARLLVTEVFLWL